MPKFIGRKQSLEACLDSGLLAAQKVGISVSACKHLCVVEGREYLTSPHLPLGNPALKGVLAKGSFDHTKCGNEVRPGLLQRPGTHVLVLGHEIVHTPHHSSTKGVP